MPQTVESFEAYLQRVREEWVKDFDTRALPKTWMGKCPFCNGKDVLLTMEPFNYFVMAEPVVKYKGQRWLYECKHCHQGFTTGESDTISIASLKKL